MIAKFTMGIIFSNDCSKVYLLRKDHPDFQAGLMNGVGGKIEPDESVAACMAREAWEEASYTGVFHQLGMVCGETEGWGDFLCHVFYSVMDENTGEPRTTEKEPIEMHPVADLITLAEQMVPHLPMLIMASLAHHAAKNDEYKVILHVMY